MTKPPLGYNPAFMLELLALEAREWDGLKPILEHLAENERSLTNLILVTDFVKKHLGQLDKNWPTYEYWRGLATKRARDEQHA